MAYITGISKLNAGYLRDWDAEELLRRQTVIFGRNGSGKSSIATALRTASADPDSSELQFTLQDGDSTKTLSAHELLRELKFHVYDKEYIKSHLGPAFDGTGLSTALFVVGEPNVLLEESLNKIQQRLLRVDGLVTTATRFQKHRDDNLKTVRGAIREKYRNLGGRKSSPQWSTAVDAMNAQDAKALEDIDREKHRETLRREPGDIPVDIGLWEPLDLGPIGKIANILDRDIESRAAALSSHLGPAQVNWVKLGVPLHEHGDQCAFCGNTIDDDRFRLLTSLVSAEEKILLDEIGILISELSMLQTATTGLHAALVDKFSSMNTISAEVEATGVELQELENYIDSGKQTLRSKSEAPSSQPSMEVGTPTFESLAALRSLAEAENQRRRDLRSDLEGEQSTARNALLADIRAEFQVQLEHANSLNGHANDRLEKFNELAANLLKEQAEQSANRGSEHDGQRLAGELTNALRLYLGHPEIAIVFQSEADNAPAGFALQRNGQTATGLSEGEKNAISLFHFLKSLQDITLDSDLRQTCVVIDDPVSSLDNESMHSAFGYLIEGLLDNGNLRVAQFIISTHSQEFFALWRNKFKSGDTSKINGPAEDETSKALLRLRATNSRSPADTSTRIGKLEAVPAALVNYRSEYYQLFEQVCSAIIDEKSFPDLALTNCARRLLEAFTLWKVPDAKNFTDRVKALPCKPPLDPPRIEALINFLHAGSHSTEIDIGNPSNLIDDKVSEYLLCLGVIRLADREHFRRMVKAVYKGDDELDNQNTINAELDVLTPLAKQPN